MLYIWYKMFFLNFFRVGLMEILNLSHSHIVASHNMNWKKLILVAFNQTMKKIIPVGLAWLSPIH